MPDQVARQIIEELEQAAQAHDDAAAAWPHIRVVADGEQLLDVPLVEVIGAGADPLRIADDELIDRLQAYLAERNQEVNLGAKPSVYRAERGHIIVGPQAYLG